MPGPFDHFQVGEPDRYGNKIIYIIGKTADLMVYTTDGDDLNLDSTSDQATERQVEIVKVFNRLDSLISVALQKRKATSLRYQLGYALFSAVADKDSTRSVNEFFADVSEQITTRALDSARFVYVTSGLATAALALLILSLFFAPFTFSPWREEGRFTRPYSAQSVELSAPQFQFLPDLTR